MISGPVEKGSSRRKDIGNWLSAPLGDTTNSYPSVSQYNWGLLGLGAQGAQGALGAQGVLGATEGFRGD